MHIFEVSDDEFFAAESTEEAIECAIREWGQSAYDESTEEFGSPMQIKDSELPNMPFNDDGKRATFKDKLDELLAAKVHFPRYFASGNC